MIKITYTYVEAECKDFDLKLKTWNIPLLRIYEDEETSVSDICIKSENWK